MFKNAFLNKDVTMRCKQRSRFLLNIPDPLVFKVMMIDIVVDSWMAIDVSRAVRESSLHLSMLLDIYLKGVLPWKVSKGNVFFPKRLDLLEHAGYQIGFYYVCRPLVASPPQKTIHADCSF
jgi:hypothetical protein